MKKLLFAVTAAVALGLTGLGCNKSPEGGTPAKNATFTLQAPTLTTDIKQGEQKVVKVSVNRDSNFQQAVTLDTKGDGNGVTATLEKTTVPSSEKDVNLTIKADKDAPLGERTITVTGKPETGNSTSVEVKIKVEKP